MVNSNKKSNQRKMTKNHVDILIDYVKTKSSEKQTKETDEILCIMVSI